MSDRLTPFERAERYVEKIDGAVSGSGGHNATFNAACRVVEFGLSEEEALAVMRGFNARCQPPWSESDLAHKVRDAFRHATHGKKLDGDRKAHRAPKPDPYRPTAPGPKETAPEKPLDVTPVDLPEPIPNGAIEFLRAAFRPEDGVRVIRGVRNEEGKEHPENDGVVLTCAEWMAKLEAKGGDMNRIMSSKDGCGIYVGLNPVRVGGSTDADVTDFRHALLECDTLPVETQLSVILASKVPCAAIIFSGGKSIHAIVRIDARDRREFDERVTALLAFFAPMGFDGKNKNPSRLTRIPEANRNGRRQELLMLGVGAESWVAWQTDRITEGLGVVRTVEQLESFDTSNDAATLLGKRYLCQGGSLTLIGPSGVGKSSLAMQFAVAWAVGMPAFGIAPARPLKVLMVQAENDEGDMAEQLEGVRAGLGLDLLGPAETVALLKRNLRFVEDTTHSGESFANALRVWVEKYKPDLVVFDPLLSFVGGDLSKQDVASQFLRGWLNPIAKSTGVAFFVVHHTGKPPSDKDARKNWQSSDWSYSGIGSSELTNWTRGAMVLRQVGPGQFQLMLAKRGKRAGATHPDGEPTTTVWLRHALEGIHWEWVQPPEAPEEPQDAEDSPRKSNRALAKIKDPTPREKLIAHGGLLGVLDGIPADGESSNSLGQRIRSFAASSGLGDGNSERNCRGAVLEELENRKMIEKRGSKWFRKTA